MRMSEQVQEYSTVHSPRVISDELNRAVESCGEAAMKIRRSLEEVRITCRYLAEDQGDPDAAVMALGIAKGLTRAYKAAALAQKLAQKGRLRVSNGLTQVWDNCGDDFDRLHSLESLTAPN